MYSSKTKNKFFFSGFLAAIFPARTMKKRNDIQKKYCEILTFDKFAFLVINLEKFPAEKQQNEEISDWLQDNFLDSKI